MLNTRDTVPVKTCVAEAVRESVLLLETRHSNDSTEAMTQVLINFLISVAHAHYLSVISPHRAKQESMSVCMPCRANS